MPTSKDPALYKDVQPLMERAKESKHGIRVTVDTSQRAHSIRLRCYAYRRALFTQSKTLFQVTEPGFECTPYDNIVISVEASPKGGWYVALRKREDFLSTLEIEELPGVEKP